MSLAVCLSAAGCSGKSAAPAAHSAKTDVAWLRTYGNWSGRLRSDLTAAGRERARLFADPSDTSKYAAAVNRFATCSRRYLRHVGDPPNPAWSRPAQLALEACRGYARAQRKFLAASGTGQFDLLLTGETALDRASRNFLLATNGFEHTLVWRRPLPHIGGVSGRSRIEPLFSRVATPIARKPVEIRCWSDGEWKMVLTEYRAFTARRSDPAGFGDSRLNSAASLAPWVCADLARLAYRHVYPRSGSDFEDMSYAAQVLSHEIQHLNANGTEAETECYGMQALEQVARGLGAPRPYARQLAVEYWTFWYPDDNSRYHTERCRNGGPLDANPDSSRWP